MNLKTLSMMGALLLLAGTGANAQKKKEVLNDSNTPLHLLQPAYKVPYGMLTTEEIKADMDRVLRYLEKNTPTRVVDKNTGKVITDYADDRVEEYGILYYIVIVFVIDIFVHKYPSVRKMMLNVFIH